jgi:hypothetical protein
MVALGTRVYLSCTLHEELVPGHCLIVPIQHHLTMLEGDDDVWDEIRVWLGYPRYFDSIDHFLAELYEEPDADVL